MEFPKRAPANAQRQRIETERVGTPRVEPTGIDLGRAVIAQRKLSDTIQQGPASQAQRMRITSIQNSPRQTAQRARVGALLATGQERSAAVSAMAAQASRSGARLPDAEAAATSAGAATNADTIQRKVGFELEDRDWRAYIEEKKAIRPASRQELLRKGTGFDLEADDSLGKTLPSLEFVTVPFEPTAEGISALDTAFHEIRAITAHIGAFAPVVNPFESERKKPPKAKEFITHKQHGLNPDLLLAGGVADARFKMQATQGVSLEDLPTVMQTFGSNAPDESTAQKAERTPARELMYGERQQASGKNQPASDLFAAAPSLAEQVVDSLRARIPVLPERKKRHKKKEKKLLEDPRLLHGTESADHDTRIGDETVEREPTPQTGPTPEVERSRKHTHRPRHKEASASRPEGEKALLLINDDVDIRKAPDPLGDTSRLVGFLSMVMLYVKLLSTINPGGDQAKYMIPLLARTNFASLFALLPGDQQELLRVHFDALVQAIVQVANAKQFIATEQFDPSTLKQMAVLHDTGFGADVALVRHPDFGLTGLTLSAWLSGMVMGGTDHLNPAAIARFLGNDTRPNAVNALESFAVLGRASVEPSRVTDDTDIEGHSRLGIFENRMIAGPMGFFTATAAHAAALSYLTYYKSLKDTVGRPGGFPHLAAPDQPMAEVKGKKEKKVKKDRK